MSCGDTGNDGKRRVAPRLESREEGGWTGGHGQRDDEVTLEKVTRWLGNGQAGEW